MVLNSMLYIGYVAIIYTYTYLRAHDPSIFNFADLHEEPVGCL